MDLEQIKADIIDLKESLDFVPKEYKAAIEKKISELEILEKELASKTKEVSDADKLLAELNAKQAAKKKTVKTAKTPAAKKKVEVEVKKVEAEKAKAVAHKAKVVKEVKDIEKDVAALIKKGGDAVAEFNKGRSAKEIMNDAEREALPAGKRISAQGNVYYEHRPDHADADPNVKLEKGGELIISDYNEREGMVTEYAVKYNNKIYGYICFDINEGVIYTKDNRKNGGVKFPHQEFENIEDAKEYIISNVPKSNYIEYDKGGLISGTLYSTYTNPIEYLSAMGAKTYSNLNYSTKKNGINYYIGTKNYKAIVVAFIEDENNYMIDKEDAREMAETARTKDVDSVELYTNYGIELSSKHETPKTIGFDKIYKITNGFAKGGTVKEQFRAYVIAPADEYGHTDSKEEMKPTNFYIRWNNAWELSRFQTRLLDDYYIFKNESELKKAIDSLRNSRGYKFILDNSDNVFYKEFLPKSEPFGYERGGNIEKYMSGSKSVGESISKSVEGMKTEGFTISDAQNNLFNNTSKGSITNQYEGKTAEQVWGEWTTEQRYHFLEDHRSYFNGNIQLICKLDYNDLTHQIKDVIYLHVIQGQYEHGGSLNSTYCVNFIDNNVKEQSIYIDAHTEHEARRIFKIQNDYREILSVEPEFEHGGNIAEGNRQMAINKAIEILHHAEELVQKTKNAEEIPAWVIALIERASTDLYDVTHYLDGVEEMEDEDDEEYHDDITNEHEEGDYGMDGFAKGGKIGLTKSNKPIYNYFEHPEHKDFTSQDHQDARFIYARKMSNLSHNGNKKLNEFEQEKYNKYKYNFNKHRYQEDEFKGFEFDKGGALKTAMNTIFIFNKDGEFFKQIRYKTKAEAIGNYKIFNKMGYLDYMTGEPIEGLTFELL